MAPASDTQRTYHHEKWRSVSAGVLETASSTFLLLIAVRWFQAGAMAKALVAGGGSIGLLITPWLVMAVARSRWAAARAAALLSWLGAASLVGMALAPSLPVFVAGSVLAMAAAAAGVPLLTQIYHDNYPATARGRLFARTIMIRIASAALFSYVAGRLFSGRLDQFPWLLLIFALAFAAAAILLGRYPSRPLKVLEGTHPLRAWRSLKEDRLFRLTLAAWMLMGFGNLMMYPLRVEYLANPRYGLALSVSLIALYTGVIPNLARLVLSPLWGWLFDHMNFFALRVTLNIGFAAGILTFFLSDSPAGLTAGAIIFGIANAGGDVAWSLWVTKLAAPDRVADYMAVHTFFTGVRGVLAPVVSFQLLTRLDMLTMGWIATGLILAASLLLVPEIRAGRTLSPGAPSAPEPTP